MRCYVLPTARGRAVGFMLRPLGSRTGSLSLPPVSQIERPYKERSHLSSSHRLTRTVVAAPPTKRDVQYRHSIYEIIKDVSGRHVQEPLSSRRWRIQLTERSNDECDYLRAQHRAAETIVAPSAAEC